MFTERTFNGMVPLKASFLHEKDKKGVIDEIVRQKFNGSSMDNYFICSIKSINVVEEMLDAVTSDHHIAVEFTADCLTFDVDDVINIKVTVVTSNGFKGAGEINDNISVIVPGRTIPKEWSFVGGVFTHKTTPIEQGTRIGVKLTCVRFEPKRVACQAILEDVKLKRRRI